MAGEGDLLTGGDLYAVSFLRPDFVLNYFVSCIYGDIKLFNYQLNADGL